jgi:hypothetical protein
MTVPAYLAYYVLAGGLGMIAATLFGLYRALLRTDWNHAERVRIWRISALVLVGWFVVALALSWFGFYRGAPGRVPTIQYGIFVPILIGAIAIWRSPEVRRLVEAIPQPWLVAIQFYRTLGAIFLILHASGRMPGLFALPAGWGDVAIGLAAPVVALLYARNSGSNAAVVRAWNVLGLADLAVAVATGFLTSPSPLQLYAFNNPNELISIFPLVLVPVFLVPLSVLLHIASLAKLRREAASGHYGLAA